MISTIILNWNRAALLRRTVESYLETIRGTFELFVVDNASTDSSREYLHGLEAQGHAKVLFLDQNTGGHAWNEALPLTRGEFVHFSANDMVFLPGWSDHAISAFDVFSDLGQLSLLADLPTDEEAWEPKPSRLRFSRGKVLYEALGNVSASSVLRGSLFRERGLQIATLENGPLRFPADGKLSTDVKAAGFWCAWSDRYYVRNVGHEVAEFDFDPEYYRENYANKPWIGVEGWEKRIAAQRKQPKVDRSSKLFADRIPGPQRGGVVASDKSARLWSSFDDFTPEAETLEFLHSLTRLVKPRRALEVRTWLGLSACAIGQALVQNGFGGITTLEPDPEAMSTAQANIKHYNLENVVTALHFSSSEMLAACNFDMAIFGSDLELIRFDPLLSDRAIVVLLGQAGQKLELSDALRALIDSGKIQGLFLDTPRGVFVGSIVQTTAASGTGQTVFNSSGV